jgi:hypothetical protein
MNGRTGDMKKAEIEVFTNESLIVALLWNQIIATKQANTPRGITKQTEKEERWLLDELAERFDLDIVELHKQLYKF